MIALTLDIERTQYGFLLRGGSDIYLMNKSTVNALATPYYLKRVEPTKEYITGLFYKRARNEYVGKAQNGQKVKLRLGVGKAFLYFY